MFLVVEHRVVFGEELAHGHFSERCWDAVEADLETRSQARGLLGVLGSELAGAFGDWTDVRTIKLFGGILVKGNNG